MDPDRQPHVDEGVMTDGTVAERFAVAVAASGERRAVRSPVGTLTYAELDAASDRVAAALDESPDGPDPVVVLVAHGTHSVVAMLGVAKSGRAFLVLDPRAPTEFLANAVRRHGGGPLLTDRSLAAISQAVAPGSQPVVLEQVVADDRRHWAPRAVDPTAPVSVSYTSGTSGVPKAVVHSQRNVLANATRYAVAVGATPADAFLVTNAFGAAAAATPVFAALLTGATLCTYDLASLGALGLAAFAERSGVTIIHLPPAALRALPSGSCLPGVRLVSLGGDRLLGEQAARAREHFPNATLLHRYSTSETNWIAGFAIEPGDPIPEGPVPLGRPVPWLDVRVVDEVGTPVPPGAVGEIVVTGDHLALGYLGDAERTAARFRVTARGRTYLTGDRARVRADDALEFAGRADDVRKVRGALVDLAAVQTALLAAPGVDAAAVVTTDAGGSTQLAAFVTGSEIHPWRVRADMAQRVPGAMVPTRIIPMDSLPLTARGKVDTSALDALAASHDGAPYVAPADDTERTITDLLGSILAVESVGRDDDLFDLGADSLALVEIRAGLHDRFGRDVTLPELLEHPTPARLAALLADGALTRSGSGEQTLVRILDGASDRTPVVLFSGGGGGHLEGLARVARELDDRTAYAVVPRGFARRARPDRTIEAMGTRVADDLLALEAGDRFLLVGHSAGGNVALETARRLEGSRVRIPLVVLLDSLAITPELVQRRSFVHRLRFALAAGRRARADDDGHGTSAARQAVWVLQFTRGRLRGRWWAATAGWLPRSGDRQHRAYDALVKRALVRRTEQPYAGAVHLIRADDVPGRALPDDLRWSTVGLGSLTIDRVPGDHDHMLAPGRAATTARSVERACGQHERREKR